MEMTTYGTVQRTECPVCSSSLIQRLWAIPYSPVPEIQIAGGYCNRLPMLDGKGQIYHFDNCGECESIFLNPHEDARSSYRTSDYHANKIGVQAEIEKYSSQYQNHIAPRLLGKQDIRVLDAGCGGGQYMFHLRNSGRIEQASIVGVELSELAVAGLKKAGFHAVVNDLDSISLPNAGLGLFDLIILAETFEHLERPAEVVAMLRTMLKPTGQLFYTAQAPQGGLAIRPGEPIYMSAAGQTQMLAHALLKLETTLLEAGRWKTVATKS